MRILSSEHLIQAGIDEIKIIKFCFRSNQARIDSRGINKNGEKGVYVTGFRSKNPLRLNHKFYTNIGQE